MAWVLFFGFGIGFGSITVFALREWILALRFYSKNNWNFALDSGRKKLGGGKFSDSIKFSNKNDMLFGYPLFIFIISVFCGGWVLTAIKLLKQVF